MNRRFYEQADGAKRVAPAAQRNVGPIGDVLSEWLPSRGLVLELASGSGQHAVAFAGRFPEIRWQPSDVHPDALSSISAYEREAKLDNLLPPLEVDAANPPWGLPRADAVLSINMVHISPWDSALGLVRGASTILPADAPLILYGPWAEEGRDMAQSNVAFDRDLRSRDPRWGIRTVEDFEAAARPAFRLVERRAMPANNLMLLFRRNALDR